MNRARGIGPLAVTGAVLALLAVRCSPPAAEPPRAGAVTRAETTDARRVVRVAEPAREDRGGARAVRVRFRPATLAALDTAPSAAVPAGAVRDPVAPAFLAPPDGPVAAHPRSVQVVAVPVPPELARGGDVHYVVVPTGNARLVGALEGVVPDSAIGSEPVLVTAAVSSRAPAGIQTVARVEYRQGGRLERTIPIRLDVAAVPGATVRILQGALGAHPGDELRLRYAVTNTGNAPDTLLVQLFTPSGWTADGVPARYVLGSGATATGEARVRVPGFQPTGPVRLTLAAYAGARELARADAIVQVVWNGAPLGAHAGPMLTTGVATVMSDARRASPVVAAELEGALTDKIDISGRIVQPTNTATIDQVALARVGYAVGAPYLSLSAADWRLTALTTGRSFSDETGVGAYGRGASFESDNGAWTTAALVAAPGSQLVAGHGELFGAQVGHYWNGAWIGATATDLQDDVLGARALTAFGLAARSPAVAGTVFSGELASRRFDGGAGLGWAVGLDRRTATDAVSVRYTDAPGGSAAFARASREIQATASHAFTRAFSVNGGVWHSTDSSATVQGLTSTGWSVAPQLALGGWGTASLELRGNAYQASLPVGQFGNAETVARLSGSGQWGTVFATAAVTAGRASRSTSLPGGPAVQVDATQAGATAGVGVATPRGTFTVDASYARVGEGVGYLPRQASVGVSAARVPLAAGRGPTLHASIQETYYFGTIRPVTVVRAGLESPLPGDLRLTVDVERNPFLTGITGRAQWVPVVKIERSLPLALGSVGTAASGVVYEDLNGNGRRDHGEPPLAGVVLRRGNATAVTDDAGRFEFYGRLDAPVEIDPASVPFGLAVPPMPAAGAPRRGHVDFGVVPTGTAVLRFVLTADSLGRVPHIRLSDLVVQAVDSQGTAWPAAVDSTGTLRLDALPPGRYRLEVDQSGLAEGVLLPMPLPEILIEAGRTVAPITIPVRPRPIRVFDPSNRRAGRGASGRGGAR